MRSTLNMNEIGPVETEICVGDMGRKRGRNVVEEGYFGGKFGKKKNFGIALEISL